SAAEAPDKELPSNHVAAPGKVTWSAGVAIVDRRRPTSTRRASTRRGASLCDERHAIVVDADEAEGDRGDPGGREHKPAPAAPDAGLLCHPGSVRSHYLRESPRLPRIDHGEVPH